MSNKIDLRFEEKRNHYGVVRDIKRYCLKWFELKNKEIVEENNHRKKVKELLSELKEMRKVNENILFELKALRGELSGVSNNH